MEDLLIELLSTFGYPVKRQGSLADDEPYPDTFFTFWENPEYELSAYDNITTQVVYDFDINIYSIDPMLAFSVLSQARQILKTNGWMTADRGHDVMSDEITHIGRGMNVLYLKNEN